jgi:RNA polymerase sigma-70 factor, ECF subfamily
VKEDIMAVAFQTLLEENHMRIQRAALGFLGDSDLAKDAAQDAMLKAYRARDRYDSTRPFYPWLYRIVKNTCFDILREQRRRPRSTVAPDQLQSSTKSATDNLLQKQREQLLWEAMQRLDDSHREIINLRHFQDLSYQEMAQMLEIAEGTVMSRLYRARKALATEMGEGR